MGRPGLYTPELGDEICRRLAEGESLNSICKTDGFPAESTVRSWIVDVKHPLTASYTRARELGYLKMADELLDIADDSTNDYMDRVGKDGEVTRVLDQEAMARSRLRLDTRKWMLSKMLPKVFGDKPADEGTKGAVTVNIIRYSDAGNPAAPVDAESISIRTVEVP